MGLVGKKSLPREKEVAFRDKTGSNEGRIASKKLLILYPPNAPVS
jgi:hypothetical protein